MDELPGESDSNLALAATQSPKYRTYCISLDPKADRYVSRIFGMRNYMVLDHIRRLPEKLPLLYMRVTN